VSVHRVSLLTESPRRNKAREGDFGGGGADCACALVPCAAWAPKHFGTQLWTQW